MRFTLKIALVAAAIGGSCVLWASAALAQTTPTVAVGARSTTQRTFTWRAKIWTASWRASLRAIVQFPGGYIAEIHQEVR
jgi:O-antigen ligase